MSKHLMIVPSLACPASCAYCFGPHRGRGRMERGTVDAVLQWQKELATDQSLEITFHGGEPLVPGLDFYKTALPILKEGLPYRKVRFSMQSNLWLLTESITELFHEYKVSLGTSLDGPEAITDAQRGKGYFRRTMAGIEKARSHGLDVGCICTFTQKSLPHLPDILSFFISEGLNFTLHSALPSLAPPVDAPFDRWSLTPEEHAEMLEQMLELYLQHSDRIQISTLDSLCRSVTAGHGGICTFTDCLGEYLAVGPDGAIYPCQRFAGMVEYVLGNVNDHPTRDELADTKTWRLFQERQERIAEECGDCAHFDICRGGCPYNALVAGKGKFREYRDPHCAAYKRIFTTITNKALSEIFADDNMKAVVEANRPGKGLLQQGRLISLMKEGPHPYETAGQARQILAAAALASTGSPEKAARAFEKLGLITRYERTLAGMQTLHKRLTGPVRGLNNIYLHITFACPLRCTHCYAEAGTKTNGAMTPGQIQTACLESSRLGFRHAVITGGEPLVHPSRDRMLDILRNLRGEIKPLLTVLRTSLSIKMDDSLLRRVSQSTDQVVVSLDGNQQTHDERRGKGSYELVVNNLRRLVALNGESELSLATVLPLEQSTGPAGDSVRELARELGIRRTRFRPLLPLGRAVSSRLEIIPETLWGHVGSSEMVAYGYTPVSTCGMGQNLYVEPNGQTYPCYAWHGKSWELGRLNGTGSLAKIIDSAAFKDLSHHSVDTNKACQKCAFRYLCGGACRAWSRLPEEVQTDLDAAPRYCNHLRMRAQSLLASALHHLGIKEEQWIEAGMDGLDVTVT